VESEFLYQPIEEARIYRYPAEGRLKMNKDKVITCTQYKNLPVVLEVLSNDWANYCVRHGNGNGFYCKTIDEANDYLRQNFPYKKMVSLNDKGNVVELAPYPKALRDFTRLQEEKLVNCLVRENSTKEWKVNWCWDSYEKEYHANCEYCKGVMRFEVTPYRTIPFKIRLRIYREDRLLDTKTISYTTINQSLVREIENVIDSYDTDKKPWNEYTKAYRKRHPEKAKQWRINAAITLLQKEGYNIVKPKED
jgi:hypothetical protein